MTDEWAVWDGLEKLFSKTEDKCQTVMVSMTFLFAAVNSGHAHYLSTMGALTCTVVHSRRVLSQTNSKMFFFYSFFSWQR